MNGTIQDKTQDFFAEPSYDSKYRFRLWVALVDDLDLLGGGYRSYTEQILRCFEDWRRRSYRILDHRGHPLNENHIKADDLYGFLGLNKDTPTGPARQLSHQKFAVLDAYFKIKYPSVAKFFSSDTLTFTMIEGIQAFLTHPDRPVSKFLSSKFLTNISGLYIPDSIQSQISANTFSEGSSSEFDFYIPVYAINKSDEFPFCIVRRISVPIEKYQKFEGLELSNSLLEAASDFSAKDTRIFSGVGFPGMDPQRRQIFSLNCILRDMTTYSPYFSNISFTGHSLDLSNPSNMVAKSVFRENYFDRSWNEYLPLHNNKDDNTSKYIVNNELFSEIDRIIKNLGLEI